MNYIKITNTHTHTHTRARARTELCKIQYGQKLHFSTEVYGC